MKRHNVILPLSLPRLSDKAAAQLIDLLQQLVAGIDYHYRPQIHRHHKRQQQILYKRQPPPQSITDPPF